MALLAQQDSRCSCGRMKGSMQARVIQSMANTSGIAWQREREPEHMAGRNRVWCSSQWRLSTGLPKGEGWVSQGPAATVNRSSASPSQLLHKARLGSVGAKFSTAKADIKRKCGTIHLFLTQHTHVTLRQRIQTGTKTN